jgi:hypothetical protein
MKTAFTLFTLDESSTMNIQSVKCKFAINVDQMSVQLPKYTLLSQWRCVSHEATDVEVKLDSTAGTVAAGGVP